MQNCPSCCECNSVEIYECKRYIGVSRSIEIRVSQCCNCGFVYNTNGLQDGDLVDYYRSSLNASGQVYRDNGKEAHYTKLHAERALFLKTNISVEHGGTFLDVGCGSGDFIVAARHVMPTQIYKGVDPSEAASNNCAKKGITILSSYLDSADVRDGEASIISAISVLEHVANPRAFLSTLSKKISPDGIIYLEVPNLLEPELQLTGFFNLEHVIHFTPFTLTRLLREFGFKYFSMDETAHNVIWLICSKSNKRILKNYYEKLNDDRARSCEAIATYIQDENKLIGDIVKKLENFFNKRENAKSKIAIYGAGAHTIELASIFDFTAKVSYYIDGDSRKRETNFLGCPVISPADVSRYDIDAVLISSGRFQDEMCRAISNSNVEIETLYG